MTSYEHSSTSAARTQQEVPADIRRRAFTCIMMCARCKRVAVALWIRGCWNSMRCQRGEGGGLRWDLRKCCRAIVVGRNVDEICLSTVVWSWVWSIWCPYNLFCLCTYSHTHWLLNNDAHYTSSAFKHMCITPDGTLVFNHRPVTSCKLNDKFNPSLNVATTHTHTQTTHVTLDASYMRDGSVLHVHAMLNHMISICLCGDMMNERIIWAWPRRVFRLTLLPNRYERE